MKTYLYFFFSLLTIWVSGQVGINTVSPETTLDVTGKPVDPNHYDGIIPPRITGDQLSRKSYSISKRGTVVFVTVPATNLSGQVINVRTTGLYYFDGTAWQPVSKDVDPIEYYILLTFDSNSTASLAATSTWTEPRNQWANTNNYLTSSKNYTIGSKNFGGLEGFVVFRKINGIVNVRFRLHRTDNSTPVTGKALIDIEDIFNDIGYFPNQIVLLHNENSTQYFPALLENYAIQIPQSSLNQISTSIYTYGEVQGYSNWRVPYLK
ncbi:hypothetical protein [Chryseobacterium indologenes]|uniref:hypothetical protein n=1 Tax=Chryseobacterium indologenes TaxID=253 RepID=UPI00063D182A|nr:hypothetical protein [Chryseobacterium indologenes]